MKNIQQLYIDLAMKHSRLLDECAQWIQTAKAYQAVAVNRVNESIVHDPDEYSSLHEAEKILKGKA